MGLIVLINGLSSRVLTAVLILLLLCEPLATGLGQTREDYEKRMREAEEMFAKGRFEGSIKIVEEILARPNFPAERRKDALELLARDFSGLSYVEQARSAIRKLLELVPTYIPPPEDPEFAQQVQSVRQELAAAAAVAQAGESAWYESPWVYVAAGAAGVGLYFLLRSTPPPPPQEGSGALARPPSMPAN
jgi:hypothetical protein